MATLYGILDKNGDEQVTVETIVRALMVDMHKNSGETSVAVKRKQEAELVALCKKKIAEGDGDVQPLMHREAFESNYKNIFGEALAWKIRHDAMRKKGSSLMDGASKMVRSMTSLSRKSSTMSSTSNGSPGGSSFELGPTCSTDDYDYKGPTRDSKEEVPPPSWTKSPEPVRIKKRPSRNAQILDSWDGVDREVNDPNRRMSTQALIDTEEQV